MPVQFFFFNYPLPIPPPTNSSTRSHCKLSSLVANPVENSNQLICQVSEISAEDTHCQLGFRVISTAIAQFMQILKDMLKSCLQCNHTRHSTPHWLLWPPGKSLNKKCFPANK